MGRRAPECDCGSQITRGAFLRVTTKTIASATILGSPLLRPQSALAVPVRVRRDVGNLSASSSIIKSYAKAVKAMKALPTSDPHSWAYQAAIHGTMASPPMTAWNTCEHGTLYFWSWHRMYLHYFERIVRKMSGNPKWALPYWNYELASERELPPPFRDPASPLYESVRGSGWNSGASSLPAWAVKRVGFTVPRTLVSTHRNHVLEFCRSVGGEVIAKKLVGAPPTPLATVGLALADLNDDFASIAICPTMYQELVRGRQHLRVNCFGSSIHAFLIESDQLDWRRDLSAPIHYVELEPAEKDLFQRLLRSLGLKMAIMDAKRAEDGALVWIELNPQGQFLFCEGLTGYGLTRQFAQFLIETARAAGVNDPRRDS